MSQCRSFGSNYHLSSQSKKISIGIVVDHSTKAKPSDVRQDAAATAIPVTRNLGSSKVDTREDMRKYEKVKDPSKEQQTDVAVQEPSPRVSTRSFQQNLLSSQGVCDAKQAPSTLFNQSQRSNAGLKTDDGLQKKFSIGICARKVQGDGSSNRVAEVPFATAQELIVPDKEVAQEKAANTENKGNDNLRMKIREVLGTVPTPTKQNSNTQTLKTCTDNPEPEWNNDKNKTSTMKPGQNSDTIESDSDSSNHTMKRPVTRSLTRKRPTKVHQCKGKNASSSSDKHKKPEKTIFSFEEGHSRKVNSSTIGDSSLSMSQKYKSSGIEPHKLHFLKSNSADETRQVTDSSETKNHIGSSSGLKNGIGRFCGYSSKGNRDAYQYPTMEEDNNLGDSYESIFPKTLDKEDVVDPSLKNIIDSQFDFNTPALGMNPPTETQFCGSPPKNNQDKQEDVHSPMQGLQGVLNMENVRSFKCFFASTLDNDRKIKETEISDGVEHEDSPVEKSLPNLKENNTVNSPSTSSSEEDGSKSSGNGSSTEGPSEAETPEIVTTQEPEILFRQTKRCRISEGADAIIFSPSSTPPQVCGKFLGLPSELNEENGLARAVSLFAIVLQRVKSKMKSAANKRSAEILMSVAMDMQLQLQNAESQIQKDVGKLTGIGKTKRKRLETRFQEQQDKLKDIYERFRNEVNAHLQDCKSTLEGMELQQTEFKDIIEEQNASHGKLLLQAEEAINTRLNDAQRRIKTIQKSARQKMLQLKYVISESLKEDALY